MHELGIAEATLVAIRKEAARYPNTRVATAGLRIGALAGVDASALRFAFEAIVRGTEFETLHLEIEHCPQKQRCLDCGRDFVVRDYDLQCPNCQGLQSDCIGGDELDLVFVEVEEYAAS
jgi:hydrogenase nickel incorporation protein HypA/HybF